MDHHTPTIEEKIQIGKIKIYTALYKSENKNNKPYLLLLHGLRSDTTRMYPIIHFMLEKYNVISFDMPGHNKSKNIEEFTNYNDYCAEKLNKLIEIILNKYDQNKYKIQKEGIKELSLFGVSSGAITILRYLIKHDPNIKFPLIGLQAPIFSSKYLSFKPHMKVFVPWLGRNLSRGKTFTKIMQKVINSDRSFKIYASLWDSDVKNDKDMLEYEKRNWRIMSMQLWGRSLMDFFKADFENINHDFTKYTDTFIFLYPEFDQYLDVKRSTQEFKKLIPQSEFKYYKLKKHAPRGEVLKNPKVAKAIKEMVYTFLYN